VPDLARREHARLEQQVRALTEKLVQVRGELCRAEERIAALTLTDDETGLYNARAFQERALPELERASRHRRDLSLVVIEPEQPSGLRPLADLARAQVRASDIVARVEAAIVLLLPETALPGALVIAERICRRGVRVTAGCAGWPGHGRGVAELLGAARSALAAARAGGHRVRSAT